ncbi:Protein apterous [Eumeta japonica]|uniref:Protein apterous n=1 Tax=Eumeta variegata TaxID=151549 RepID=A0A4C2A3S0_EUMVA|nr:Protein apterous [Eumeta japonica]
MSLVDNSKNEIVYNNAKVCSDDTHKRRAWYIAASRVHHGIGGARCYWIDAKHVRAIIYRRVWFQNARAKWRRMVTKQENKMTEKCSPDGSLEMDMYHGSIAGSIQSMPPHSPPYSVMGGPASPNSMECP